MVQRRQTDEDHGGVLRDGDVLHAGDRNPRDHHRHPTGVRDPERAGLRLVLDPAASVQDQRVADQRPDILRDPGPLPDVRPQGVHRPHLYRGRHVDPPERDADRGHGPVRRADGACRRRRDHHHGTHVSVSCRVAGFRSSAGDAVIFPPTGERS